MEWTVEGDDLLAASGQGREGALGLAASPGDDRDVVGERLGLVQQMRAQQHRAASIADP